MNKKNFLLHPHNNSWLASERERERGRKVTYVNYRCDFLVACNLQLMPMFTVL